MRFKVVANFFPKEKKFIRLYIQYKQIYQTVYYN